MWVAGPTSASMSRSNRRRPVPSISHVEPERVAYCMQKQISVLMNGSRALWGQRAGAGRCSGWHVLSQGRRGTCSGTTQVNS